MKKWVLRKKDDNAYNLLKSKTDLTSLCASVLSARGIKDTDSAVEFFSDEELSDPFLLKDMQKACDIIQEKIESGDLICIFGDYDCDGVTSTTVLYTYLECSGANVMYYIPEREEGYGMSKEAIDKLSAEGVELIITVDNGISALEEADYIDSLGMQLIVTDHHQPSETLPKALAVVNPHRKDDVSPFKELCGVGVVMKLVAALDGGSYDATLEQFADLICIGTIADVVKLTGENRTIVKRGLRLLSNTENEGLSMLLDSVKLKENISAVSVAFLIAPRINAAGRFASASIAVRLLLGQEENPAELVNTLMNLNNERKKTENDIISEIEKKLREDSTILDDRVLVIDGNNWHHGVVGIVCSRIMERFSKPVFIISTDENEARGSARSIKGFNVFEALSYCKDILIRYGGHELAGGFSLMPQDVPQFRKMINEYAQKNVPVMPVMTLVADKALEKEDLTCDEVESLKMLEPFGEGNPEPLFLAVGALIEKVVSLSQGKHSKLEINYKGVKLSGLLFGVSPEALPVKAGMYADMLAVPEINDYNSRKSVVLRIKDIRKSGMQQDKYFSAKSVYEQVKRKEPQDKKLIPRIVPDRNDLVAVYKYISTMKKATDTDSIFCDMSSGINYCKLRLCIDIMEELGFAEVDKVTDVVTFVMPTKKVDIESSQILKELRCL